MGPPSYMRSVLDRNVSMRRIPVHSMTFAQRRNRLQTHFSERIPVVKRAMSAFTFIFFIEIFFEKSDHGHWQMPYVATIFRHTMHSYTWQPLKAHRMRCTVSAIQLVTNSEVVPYGRTCIKRVKAQNQSFVTSATNRSNGLASRPGRFNHGTHWIEHYVGPGAVMDFLEEINALPLQGFQPRIFQRVA